VLNKILSFTKELLKTPHTTTTEPQQIKKPRVYPRSWPKKIEQHGKPLYRYYSYKDVCIVGSEFLSNKEPLKKIEINTILALGIDTENPADENAVRFFDDNGDTIGYMPEGNLQEMANDYLRRGDSVFAIVNFPERLKCEVGFFKDTPRVKRDAFVVPVSSGKTEYQENLDCCSEGDDVTIEEYDEKCVVYCDGDVIGTISSSAYAKIESGGFRAEIQRIETTDSLKSKAYIEVYR